MDKVKALLFDLDGTLINSEAFHFDCWNELLQPYDIQLDFDLYMKEYAGVSLLDNSRRIIDVYQINIAVETLANRREQIYLDRLAGHRVALMPYALETVQYFNELGISMGLVTSSSRPEVELILEKSRLAPYFSSIVTRTDIVHCKPHPEPYLQSVKHFGYPSNEFIVFEDSLSGVRSAKNARLRCFGIQQSIPEMIKIKTEADLVFGNLDEAKRYIVQNGLL